MKIAIITSGILPLPAVLGGAVESLTDFYLEYNEHVPHHDITVYSMYHEKTRQSPATGYRHTHYRYIKNSGWLYKIQRKIFGWRHRFTCYYYYHIEYFLHRVLRLMKKESYDLIILENRPGYAVTVARTYPETRIVLHLHNDLLNHHTHQATEIHQCCSLVLAVSDYIKRRVDTIEEPSKCKVCHNGIDVERFRHSIRTADKRAKLNFRDTDFIVVYSGRMIPEKGVKELIEAFAQLTAYPDIKLLMLGGSFYGNEPNETQYMKELRQSAATCQQQICFTGFRPYEEIPSLLRCADIGVVPSIWEEPFALTCAEGLAAGLPLIATRSGGIPEVVDEQCTLLLDKGEKLPDRLAEAILYLYRHPAIRERMSAHAFKRAANFSKELYSIDFYNHINELATNQKSPSRSKNERNRQ